MTMAGATKPGMVGPDKPSGRYSVFAITCGVVFGVLYPLILNYGWQLFTYYPAVGKFALFDHPLGDPSAGPKMKWFGYVVTASIVSVVAGLVVCAIPEKLLNRFWWSGWVWVIPILSMIALLYLIVVLGK
jgi:hypothetical protein